MSASSFFKYANSTPPYAHRSGVAKNGDEMSRITRFAGRDPGPAARVAGFMAHLRANGLSPGVADSGLALAALAEVRAADPTEARAALRAVCTTHTEDAARFDALFDSYWMDAGRVRQKLVAPADAKPRPHNRSTVAAEGRAAGTGRPDGAQDDGPEEAAREDGTGQLVASRVRQSLRRDLRAMVTPEEIAAAARIAERLGAAIRDRRSRRRRAARKGAQIDLRRMLRRSLATGGEPLALPRRRRPDRPVRLFALCDVSGSMEAHARVFLAFLAGLIRADTTADAWAFHTRLVHVGGALRENNPLRALDRLTLMAEGFGAGSRIATSLEAFARGPARRRVDRRSLVIILSDGYDTDPPEALAAALGRLRRRGCRIVWVNPLGAWREHAPVARGMAAARPHLDLLAPGNTLAALAALEPTFARL